MFNVRPDWDLPGLHNFKPPEVDFPGLHNFKAPAEEVPGFRINVDGPIRQPAVPTAWPDPDVGGNSFGFPDGAPATVPASDGRPEACPLFGRVGPNCVYQCSPTRWVYYPAPYAGMCQPFIVPGHGTRPWGGGQ